MFCHRPVILLHQNFCAARRQGPYTLISEYLPVTLPVGDLGFRGTDVECVVASGGSGYVKLYSDKLELKRRDTGAVMAITAGQTFRFKNFKVVGH